MARKSAWSPAVAILSFLVGVGAVSALPAQEPVVQAKITKQLEAGKKALRDGKYETALRAFAKADKLSDGGSTTAVLGLAAAHLRLSHFLEAEAQAEKALAMAALPDEQAVAYNLMGTALSRRYETIPLAQKDDRELTLTSAESAFRKSLDLTGGDLAAAWSNLALVLERQRRLEEAQAALQEYLDRAPSDTSARDRQAQIEATLAWRAKATQAIVDRKLFKVDGDGEVLPPQKISAPPPQYRKEDRKAGIQGLIILGAIIDEEGNVADVTVLKGASKSLNEAAVEAARKWKFKPATRNGEPVAVLFNLTINFRLQ